MSRNGTGTYALPSGNPVAAGDVAEATWANSTMEDVQVALTDSLSRTGKGGMAASLKLQDGSVSNPALTFTNFVNTGMYAVSATDFRVTVSGVDRMRFRASGNGAQLWNAATSSWNDLLVGGAALAGVDGTVSAPAYSYASDTDTGTYLEEAGDVRMAVAGVDSMRWRDGGQVPQVQTALGWADVSTIPPPEAQVTLAQAQAAALSF